jgi:hypothetical protein
MWEKLAYPRKGLPQIYDLTYFDRQGNEIEKESRQYIALSSDVEREVQFHEVAERMGASAYNVHLMTHNEVWERIREEEGSLFDRYLAFVAETIGLNKMLENVPSVMRQQETISLEL